MSALHRALAVVLLTALVVPAVAGSGDARPPPKAICGVCAEADERETVDGVPVVVESSSTTIRVDENGTGHWTSKVRLNDAAALELAADDGLRRRLVADAFDRYAAVEDPENRRSRVSGRTLVVEYEVGGMAHESTGGVLLVDFFYWHGDGGRWFRLGADRVVLKGPPGTAVTYAPGGPSVRSGSRDRSEEVVWRAHQDDWTTLDEVTYVAFGPRDGVGQTVASVAAVQFDVFWATAGDLPGVAAVPMAVLAVVVGMLAFRGEWLVERSRLHRTGAAIAVSTGLAALSMVVPVVAGALAADDAVYGWLFALAVTGIPLLAPVALLVVGVEFALVTGWRPWTEGSVADAARSPAGARTPRAVARSAVIAVLGVALVAAVFSVVSGGKAALGVEAALLATPVALFLPLGASERAGHPVRHLLRAGIVAAPLALGVASGPFGGFAEAILPVLFAPWAVLTGFVGLLAWPLGYALFPENGRERPEVDRSSAELA